MMSKRIGVVSVVLLTVLTFAGCSEVKRDALPVPKGSVPMVIDPGSDSYKNTGEDMAEIKDKPKPSASSTSKPETFDPFLEKDLCTRVGDNVIEFSKISAQDSDSAYISRILDFELTADNRDTYSIPDEGEVSVVIECRVQIELSTGDIGSVSIYELVDGEGLTRVRWDDYAPE